jgi:hypothetical protein
MKPARLKLLSHHVQRDDYLVVSGVEPVGRIYRRTAPTSEWIWTISSARCAEMAHVQLAGRTSSLKQAKHELTDNWAKVLAAGLASV